MQTTILFNIKREYENYYVIWLDEPYYNRFDTLIDTAIIKKPKITSS